MKIDVGALVIWHGERVPDWGGVVGLNAEHVFVSRRRRDGGLLVVVKHEDVFGVADTLAALSDAYAEHVPACALCQERRRRFMEQVTGCRGIGRERTWAVEAAEEELKRARRRLVELEKNS